MYHYCSDSEDESCTASKQIKKEAGSQCNPIPVDPDAPGPSSALTKSEQLSQLMEMFPTYSEVDLRTSLALHGTVAGAALSMSTIVTSDDSVDDSYLEQPAFSSSSDIDSNPVSLPTLLEKLQEKLSNEREKLKVDEEDLLNDSISYYKDPKFDPRQRLRVIYNRQPAADTGGVTRQFFTQLLHLISNEFFHGENFKSPIYNSDLIASGIMKICETIIVHSILQGGPGMPIFSPAVYHYLATADIDAAVQKLTVNDCSLRTKSYINMVSTCKCLY